MDISLALVLVGCVFLFTVSAWRTMLKRPGSAQALGPVLFLTLSSLLQVAFIILVWREILTLDYSLRFAALGLPCCVLALILASRRKVQKDQPRGAAIEAFLGLVMWMFLISAH